ncbi:Disease resistance protein [Melia azedarach]|uniref:Disease resistance protein n=1 Tax=Melia azedarach TaxID=155640 RepID=A0ACC1Y516_MELAZ|nr:Disease resistance protein [Melia azedarach]
MLGRLQILEDLEVRCCDSLEEVFEFQTLSGQMAPAIAAAPLRKLHFCCLPNLKHVWDMDSQTILAFDSLLKMRVHVCRGLKSLFPASIANDLHKLEELEICCCSLENIIAEDDKVEESVIPRFRFPRLTSLTLRCLPALKAFHPKTHISDWPALKKMEVSGCTTGCGTVQILVSEFQSQLNHLQSLFLVDKVIVAKEGEEDAADKIVVPLLKSVILESLPDLTCFYSGSSVLKCPSLETIAITNCTRMEAFVFPNMPDLSLQSAPFFSDRVSCATCIGGIATVLCLIEMICHRKLLATSYIHNLILRYLLRSGTVKNLGELQQVSISKCTSIEAAILMEEEGMSQKMTFPRQDCWSSKIFQASKCSAIALEIQLCSQDYQSLMIDKCGSMKTFVSNSISAIAQGSAENVHSDVPLFDEKLIDSFNATATQTLGCKMEFIL